jgi:peptidoglycan hydrolase-like protein with peptidoglycan-binding domain
LIHVRRVRALSSKVALCKGLEHWPPDDGVQIPIKIGDLDPEKKVSGQQARLKNLGYFRGDVDGQDSDDFESAVEEFQCDHSLKVDGICGPKTQAKLKEVHGC